MQSANTHRFFIFRGFFLEVVFYWISMLVWMPIIVWPFAILIMAEESEIGLVGALTGTLFLVFWRSLYVSVKRLIFRRLEIDLYEDHIDVTYLPFLFLRKKTVRLQFADMATCKQIRVESRVITNHLEIIMKDGRRYRISSDILWFKKIVYHENYDIGEIALAYGNAQRRYARLS